MVTRRGIRWRSTELLGGADIRAVITHMEMATQDIRQRTKDVNAEYRCDARIGCIKTTG